MAPGKSGLHVRGAWSLLKFMSIELVMPSNHLILYRPLLLLPSIFPSIRVFSPACRGTFGGRRKAVRERFALQGGTGDFP